MIFFRNIVARFDVTKLTLVLTLLCALLSFVIYLMIAFFIDHVSPIGVFVSLLTPVIVALPICIILLRFARSLYFAQEKTQCLLNKLVKKNEELQKAYEELSISEAELIQSEKMASLGQLSAGIAHELKNPLGIIIQGISYVQSSVEDRTLIDACDRIKKSAIRADAIILNLLSFSRQTSPSFNEMDINILVEEALAMVEHQMNLQNIQIIRSYAHYIPKVRVDSNQIKQVFINIFINAAEAMQDGGTITITTRTGFAKGGKSYIEVAITDTGTGIPEEILKNVFDPFFTTKRDSGGTGLGLSVTKGIIDHHQGSISIKSKEGVGTTVTITLPCNLLEKEGDYNE